MIRILAYGLFLTITTALPCASAVVSEKATSKSSQHLSATRKEGKDNISIAKDQKQTKEDAELLNKIEQSAQSYKDNPSNETYTELWQGFENWVRQLTAKHIDASIQCKSCPALAKAGLKIIDATGSGGAVKIYTFNPQAIWTQNKTITIESRNILIQSTEQIAESTSHFEKHYRQGRTKRLRRSAHVRKAAALHMQSINIPPNTEIKQASILNGAVSKIRFLAILGLDLQSGHYWLDGLKHTNTDWSQDAELWQQVPSFLLQTGQAKVRLSENNFVITIGGRGVADNNGGISSYELVMPFVENHFALTRNEAQDPAKAVALQFLLALQGKRADLAKIWLVDPQLASIPGYLGLYGRQSNSPALKLISMSPPLNGGVRFRLITYMKDDLILDVGKIKTQWLVKGIYIAPADPLAREIGRILPPETPN